MAPDPADLATELTRRLGLGDAPPDAEVAARESERLGDVVVRPEHLVLSAAPDLEHARVVLQQVVADRARVESRSRGIPGWHARCRGSTWCA